MENGGHGLGAYSNRNRGQNGGNEIFASNMWELNTPRFDWENSGKNTALFTIGSAATETSTADTTSSAHPEDSAAHPFMFPHQSNFQFHNYQQHSLYAGDGSHLHPDPHLTCLQLGKRHYLEDTIINAVDGFSIGKKGKPYCTVSCGPVGTSSAAAAASAVAVPMCQVEGCHVSLFNAKDYHRRHKVCEVHSKAPKVIVLGLDQRFCQQCSRFHLLSEFDDSKRSCRRRLAGHNERRRKSSHDSLSRNSTQDRLIPGRFASLSLGGCARSLLSSMPNSWFSPPDLSSRSSAALRELIAEHRAAIFARQLVLDQHSNRQHAMQVLDGGESQSAGSNSFINHQHPMFAEPHTWDDRFHEAGTHVTLDLMQPPSPAFGYLGNSGKNKEEQGQCSELWASMDGPYVV